MEEITIVVVAYNRKNSLERLLNSLNKVNYLGDKVRLYISIDKDEKNIEKHTDVVKIAREFKWIHGEKIVNCESKNIGLKKHIMQCGNLTNKYGNIIVLEDDLIVSPLMYIYAKQVLNYYKEDERIAGFGLYSFQRNPINNLPFYPLNNGCDVYFMQYACSWGQMWTKKQWNNFYNWYSTSNNEFRNKNIPQNIYNWGEKSWLKYFIKYVIEKNKYFVYPQVGVTSNFTESGTNNLKNSFAYQCVMGYANDYITYRYTKFDDAINIYDAFFENTKMAQVLDMSEEVICDFYGNRIIEDNNWKYLLTTKKYNYEVVAEYSLQMYPYELNIINNIEGNDIKLYNLRKKCPNKANEYNILRYIFKLDLLNGKQIKFLIYAFVKELCGKVLNKIKGKKK